MRKRVSELETRLAAALREAGARRALEAALEGSQARSRALFTALLDPTVVIDAQGTIEAASDSVERVFGYRPEELAGQNVRVLMPEPHRTRHDGYLEQYHRTGETNILNRTREFEVLHKDGSRFVSELSVARADIPDGEPLFVGSFRDVSERKRAEVIIRDSERRFHALFDGAFQFIGLLRPDGTLLEANRTATESIRVAREDVVGRLFWQTRWWEHSQEIQERIHDAVRRAARGELVRFEVPQRGPHDSFLDVDLSFKPVRDDVGDVVLIIAEGRDITVLKAAQKSETAMLRALAVIGESAAVLAHEIKNPITALNLALRAVAEHLKEDDREVIGDLVGRMKRLEQLMRRTLSFAKPIALDRGPCDAEELFATVKNQLELELERLGAEVRSEVAQGGVRFSADSHLLQEVLANLITNAVEAKGTGAIVSLAAARAGREAIVLTVEDNGPGIPAGQRESIFKPFFTTKSSGTGLGLAICRKIVEEHGGTIRIEDGRLGGARFVIRLKTAS